jgi:hypothetical protein
MANTPKKIAKNLFNSFVFSCFFAIVKRRLQLPVRYKGTRTFLFNKYLHLLSYKLVITKSGLVLDQEAVWSLKPTYIIGKCAPG